MPKQTVTIELEVPEGYEATGEYRLANNHEWFLGSDFRALRWEMCCPSGGTYFILRRKTDPVQEWCAKHPWLPNGVWVYRWSDNWYVSGWEPQQHTRGYLCHRNGFSTDTRALTMIFMQSFFPPPVDCLQVKRGKE